MRCTPRSMEMVVVVSISGAMSGTMTPERFTNGEATFSDVRRFETTGPYRQKNDLR